MILIYAKGDTWYAKHTGDDKRDVMALFDTDTLPTPFKTTMSLLEVVTELQEKNPNTTVRGIRQ